MRILFFVFLFLTQVAFCQQKQMSLEDAIVGKYSYLQPQSIENIGWKDRDHFSYVKENILWVGSVKTDEKKQLLTLVDLQKYSSGKFPVFPDYKWLNEHEILFSLDQYFLIFDVEDGKVKESISVVPEAEDMDYCSENNTIAYTLSDDLYLKNKEGQIKRITKDGGNGIVNGSYVHRREFGISKGIFWSENGNYLAFYRKDESMVKDYPLVDYMAHTAEIVNVKYPMAGMNSHHVKLGIYNLKTGQTVFLKTGGPLDHYLTNITWPPDEKSIYLMELNRGQDHMKLNKYGIESGELIQTLFEEKSNSYVEPLTPIQFSNINSEEFYYLSRRDGWMHLYKYNVSGGLIRQVTNGEWEVTKILGFDAKENQVFIEATKDSPVENNIYKVSLRDGTIQRLNSESGVHHAIISPEGRYLVDTWSSSGIPSKTGLISSPGKYERDILVSENPLAGFELGENTLFSIKTDDGETDLFCRMIKPVDFDPGKKYPVVVYVYGGPHSQLVNNSWLNNARWWQYYMASKGFIAFTLDNRGTSNRGANFENAIFRQLGILETTDQMSGVKYLKSLPFVDKNRIGVHGWSYGGFMVLNMMLRHPGEFKVGVAGGPVVDWSMYEIMYGERYMDTPLENPAGYENSNMLNYIPNLKGKLMLIHGVQDETVVMQNSMKFLRECVIKQKQVDFFSYPTHPHNIRGMDRLHLMEKVSNYFIENL